MEIFRIFEPETAQEIEQMDTVRICPSNRNLPFDEGLGLSFLPGIFWHRPCYTKGAVAIVLARGRSKERIENGR